MGLPSSTEHCEPCGFEELRSKPPVDAPDSLMSRRQQRIAIESRAVGALVADPTKLSAAQHRIEHADSDDPSVVLTRPAVLCAQTILRGECELFMVRKKGPQAGKLAPKLRVTR